MQVAEEEGPTLVTVHPVVREAEVMALVGPATVVRVQRIEVVVEVEVETEQWR
jgi:hypothetical protein